MAFTFCTNCGNKIEDGVIKCPYCGHIKGSERNYTYGSYGDTPNEPKNEQQSPQEQAPQNDQKPHPQENGYDRGQNPYGGQQDQNPYSGNYGQSPYNQNPYGQNQSPYGQNPYNNQNPYGMPPPGGFYRPVNDRPLSAGLLIFSIINIIFGCCCSVGFVFGIIALVYTLNARQAPTDDEEVRRKKIALFMNITAVVLTLAFIVAFSVAFTSGLIAGM